MGLPDTKTLSNRIYNARPVATLADAFGLGVLAFVPPSLPTSLKQLSGGSQSKEFRFAYAVDILQAAMPLLRSLCDEASKTVVQPLLDRQTLPFTKATLLASTGRSSEMQRLSIWDLVQGITTGIVTETDEAAGALVTANIEEGIAA